MLPARSSGGPGPRAVGVVHDDPVHVVSAHTSAMGTTLFLTTGHRGRTLAAAAGDGVAGGTGAGATHGGVPLLVKYARRPFRESATSRPGPEAGCPALPKGPVADRCHPPPRQVHVCARATGHRPRHAMSSFAIGLTFAGHEIAGAPAMGRGPGEVTRTTCPPAGSVAICAPIDGGWAPATWCQSLPLQSQVPSTFGLGCAMPPLGVEHTGCGAVAPLLVPVAVPPAMPAHPEEPDDHVVAVTPPNSRVLRDCGSYAMSAPKRAGGDVEGCSWIHVCPSHDQVSPRMALARPRPPNISSAPEASSKASAACVRGGGLTAVPAAPPKFARNPKYAPNAAPTTATAMTPASGRRQPGTPTARCTAGVESVMPTTPYVTREPRDGFHWRCCSASLDWPADERRGAATQESRTARARRADGAAAGSRSIHARDRSTVLEELLLGARRELATCQLAAERAPQADASVHGHAAEISR